MYFNIVCFNYKYISMLASLKQMFMLGKNEQYYSKLNVKSVSPLMFTQYSRQ